MFLKEVIEVGHLREAQCVGNVRYAPAALFEQRFRFLQQPIRNQLRRCFTCRFTHGPVQVIDVHVELTGKVRRGP